MATYVRTLLARREVSSRLGFVSPKSTPNHQMTTRQRSKTAPRTFLDDENLIKKHREDLEKSEKERVRVQEELAKCERLTAADFAVRINARD
jgi:hypothetical protein